MLSRDKVVRYEYIGRANPLNLNLYRLGVGVIKNVEIQRFQYIPPTGSVNPQFLGISINGLRGRYNEDSIEVPFIQTLVFQGGQYLHETDENDYESSHEYGLGTNIEIGFSSRDGGSNDTSFSNRIMNFSYNYILSINFVVGEQM